MNSYKGLIGELLEKNQELCEKNKQQRNEIDEKKEKIKKLEWLEKLFLSNQNRVFESSKTKQGELVFIFEGKEMQKYYLYGMNGCNESGLWLADCKVSIEKQLDRSPDQSERIFLTYVSSYTKRRGYASALLSFIIDKAKKSGAKEIWGHLSSADTNNLPGIIQFYESLGFKCTLYEKPNGRYVGKISMILTETDTTPP